MNTSGLVLDIYDDTTGEVLRKAYPSKYDLPEVVKTASVLSAEDREKLPDDLFSLVVHTEGEKLRKFACYDKGNTVLSVAYFLKTAHKLPGDMQKVAAANLCKACSWYQMDPPEELKKIASGGFEKVSFIFSPVNLGIRALAAPSIAKNTSQQIKSNQQAVKAVQRATGMPVVTSAQINPGIPKMADITGTHVMPFQNMEPKKDKKAVLKKTAESFLRERRLGIKKEAYEVETEGRLQAYTGTLNGRKPAMVMLKHASHYALRDKYPIDTREQVKKASDYFTKYRKQLSPEDRHEYAHNLTKRASQLGMVVSREIQKYGSKQCAPDHEFAGALFAREFLLTEPSQHAALEKIAHLYGKVRPEVLCKELEAFDKTAGIETQWDILVPDPYYSAFGLEKYAGEEICKFTDEVEGKIVTGDQLQQAAKNKHKEFADLFGEDFATEFQKDPISIYKSMPRDQKLVIINKAQSSESGGV